MIINYNIKLEILCKYKIVCRSDSNLKDLKKNWFTYGICIYN